ncbi:hypothetical protein LIER_19018 [Lithospermum erythrorhizon]|uniref:Uncharacterized protein n=1 Tax=Lithospermum erythrorhizon TaxID=34254 RepID=A0AAV3QKI2_LITER
MNEKVSMISFFHGLQFGPLKERLVLEPVANVHPLYQLNGEIHKTGRGKKGCRRGSRGPAQDRASEISEENTGV